MQRITISNLRAVCATINRVTASPVSPWRTEPVPIARPLPPGVQQQTVMRANIGNYHISEAYGGYCLHRMVNESGGVSDVFSCGHIPARDLFERMHAFMRGIETGQELGAVRKG